jgi:phosphohistidine phosphatase
MELFVLRHAIAEDRDLEKYPDDSERPLTSRGAKRMRRIAEGMTSLGLEFDAILSSSYTRAKHTAEILAEVFGADSKLKFIKPLETGDNKKLIDEINALRNAEGILLVGHEPHLSQFISLLLVGDSHLRLNLKKGGLCKLSVETLKFGQCASLEWLLPPSISVHLE